ncbi:MAG: efflux RND transporter periplasmic adaptor subunit [Synergistaceae bacterium]|jgi:RND family efflux transporter MFP subunit|nr:efflux RND transporter periplasmic adaptor subunit [Synergistaceae bacterium]
MALPEDNQNTAADPGENPENAAVQSAGVEQENPGADTVTEAAQAEETERQPSETEEQAAPMNPDPVRVEPGQIRAVKIEPEARKDLQKPAKNRMGTVIAAIIMLGVAAYAANLYLSDKTASRARTAAGAGAGARPAPSVVLNTVVSVDLATEREYIGRVESMQTVQLRPQVSGQIAGVHFKEGSLVKEGDLLFSLDARQYQATVDLRNAELGRSQAALDRAQKYLNRLKSADRRSVSASDLDVAEAEVLQAKAAVNQAQASLRLARLDLGYTKITAPITGRIGGALFTKGNFVTPSSGPLANIVQVNPIRVAFALPDRDYLDALVSFESVENVFHATILLPNGKEYPFVGQRDFEENVMDDRSGTMTIRLRFENDGGALIPGSMVRVRTRPARSHVAILVPQEAVLTDAQGDYIYVVDAGNVTHQRRVTLGAEEGTMREVVSGLITGENIVVYGLQSIRPEMKVAPLETGGKTSGKTSARAPSERGSSERKN